LIEITNDGSYVLIMCVIGVWQHAAKHRSRFLGVWSL